MTNNSNRRSYTGLLEFHTFNERFEYLSLKGRVGEETFGSDRWLNQQFYRSGRWRNLREMIAIRDEGCDLGMSDYPIVSGRVIVHHIVPMTLEDFDNENPLIWDPDNLITTTHETHNAIHYGDATLLREVYVERQPGDTMPWLRR